MSYATLQDARNQQRSSETFDDTAMRVCLEIASARVDAIMASAAYPYFEPAKTTRSVWITPDRVISANRNALRMDYPLLELVSVMVDDVDITSTVAPHPSVGATHFTIPYKHIYIHNTYSSWYTISTSLTPIVDITGIWGMVPHYTNSFVKEDAIKNIGGINTTTTTITVGDVAGPCYKQLPPRFSPGQLIKIGTECMRVDAVNTTTNTIVVRRAQNGTVAAAHTQNDVISVFYPDVILRHAVATQAALLYARRGAFEQVSSSVGVGGFAMTSYPPDLLVQLRNALQKYVNW